jgi:MFS family permease
LTGTITIPLLIAVSVVQGLVNAFDMPTRQAFVVALIEDKNDLGNAIALNSSMFNAARLLGPTVAGAIIAASNEGWCFLIDGFSYLAVLGSLLAMRVRATRTPAGPHASPLEQFKEGWHYAYTHRAIRSIITLIALVCLVGVPYTVLMPIFAATVLHGGAHTLGFLMTASGGGALLGALYLAGRRSTVGLGRIIPVAASVFGVGLMMFAFSRVLWLSIALMVITGFGFMVQVASSNTLLQTIVDDSKRGRVMSFFLMSYFGTTPFGSLMAGWMSERFGASWTLAVGGALCVAGAIWFSTRSSIEYEVAPAFAAPDSLAE